MRYELDKDDIEELEGIDKFTKRGIRISILRQLASYGAEYYAAGCRSLALQYGTTLSAIYCITDEMLESYIQARSTSSMSEVGKAIHLIIEDIISKKPWLIKQNSNPEFITTRYGIDSKIAWRIIRATMAD